MRIVGGRLRGRPIAGPTTSGLRPTSDRVREALFNILAHGIEDFDIGGGHVLDLFAGTGALGLEALSRGAASCVFVENAASSRALIQENITNLGLGGAGRIFRRDATNLGTSTQTVKFNLVFADPPYGQGLAERAIASAAEGGWLAIETVLVIEERAGVTLAMDAGIAVLETRTYGDTQITIARYRSDPA